VTAPRLLIVDDDEAMLDALQLALAGEWEVHVARDGIEALERLEERSVDVILLDLLMPRMDGRLFLHEASRRGIRTPVVIASAMVNVPAMSRRLGIGRYLQKPFGLDQLEQHLEGARRDRERAPPT
jgi:two-component system response regulator MprA